MKKLVLTVVCTNLILAGFASSSLAAPMKAVQEPSQVLSTETGNSPINTKLVKQTDDYLKYSYTLDGENYVIEENFKGDYEVSSVIYLENKKTGELEFFEELNTSYDEKKDLIVQVNHEGDVSETVVEPESEVTLYNSKDAQLLSNGSNFSTFADQAGEFLYKSTTTGSSKPTQWLVGVIAITIASITKMPATGAWAVKVAGFTYAFNTKTVYYKYVNYQKNAGSAAMVARTFRYVYPSSARTNPIANSVTDYSRGGTSIVSTRIY
ncbi:hypothetical protein [Planococcus sp. NCCP-2050]|uniref:hypothetical protein n=1 Tax=Planococcus sp. NCCP-2050 TaxID=2944679 RepID=UPI00203E45B8|nr:hypothetical protein [Planococcus sp. NCCP-2050]GKW46894.1 hypothetical protein NCCP2050_25860 [Planococcus sp. NCCP-2050]